MAHRARRGALLIGVGMGGFVDGILLHQILQWHQMLSHRLPPSSLPALHTNMLFDGLFHAAVWMVTAFGILLIWRAARAGEAMPAGRDFAGTLLLGWGAFNLIEGVIDHHLFRLHNVREVAEPAIWNYGFLLIGGIGLMWIGWWLRRGAV